MAANKSGDEAKEGGAKHLVLAISSPSTFVPTIRDASGARVANRYACKFEVGTWALPRFEHKGKVLGHGGEIILGLAEWVCGDENEAPPAIIGGTFAVRGVKSPAIYESLCRVMRIAVYVHLAIHLELSLMQDLHVKLIYPPPPVPPTPPALLIPSSTELSGPLTPSDGKRHGIWGFLAKTSELVHGLSPSTNQRHPSITRRSPLRSGNTPLPEVPAPNRGSLDSHSRSTLHDQRPIRPSLDLSRVFSSSTGPPSAGTGPRPALPPKVAPSVPPKSVAPQPAVSTSNALGVVAFPSSSPTSPDVPRPVPGGFAALLETLKSEASVLSTSPGIAFGAPGLIVRLAEKETETNEDLGDFITNGGRATAATITASRLTAATANTISRIGEESNVPSRSQTPTPSSVLRRPTGDEKAGLASILGWKGNTGSSADLGPVDLRNQWRANSIFGVGERGLLRTGSIFGLPTENGMTVRRSAGRAKTKTGKEWKGRGMCGVAGFVRHQGLTMLYAEYVDVMGSLGIGGGKEETVTSPAPATTAADVTGGELISEPKPIDEKGSVDGSRPSSGYGPSASRKATATTTTSHRQATAQAPAPKICVQAHWRTYRYFRFGRSASDFEEEGDQEGEGSGEGAGKSDSIFGDDHESDNRRDSTISGSSRREKDSPTSSRTGIAAGKNVATTTSKVGDKIASDGSQLALDEPLGMFVTRLCQSAERDDVCQEPGCGEYISKHRWLDDVLRNLGRHSGADLAVDEKVRSELRLQITDFWKGIKDHLDELELYLEEREANPGITHKRLPTTPPDSDTETEGRPRVPRKRSALPPTLPRKSSQPSLAKASKVPALTRSASMQGSSLRRGPSPRRLSPLSTPVPPPPPPPPPVGQVQKNSNLVLTTPAPLVAPPPTALPMTTPPLFPPSAIDRALLKSLRAQLSLNERELYESISRAEPGTLNDIRRHFIMLGRGAVNRIKAWETKHAPEVQGSGMIRGIKSSEPWWWGKDTHVIPGCDIIVREGDLGSIIAFTLSSTDYATELENLRNHRVTSYIESADEGYTSSKLGKSMSSTSVVPSRVATPTPQTAPSTPDPDQDNPSLWGEAESYSTVITRKENPRDLSILGFRDVLRPKRTVDSGTSLPSKFSTLGSSGSRTVSGMPPSAWSKPACEVSTESADGKVASSVDEEARKLLTEHYEKALGWDATTSAPSKLASQSTTGVSAPPAYYDLEESSDDDEKRSTPAPPPKDIPLAPVPSSRPSEQGTLTSVFASAVKYVLNPLVDKPLHVHHVGLMAVDPNAAYGPIDERPHIKYDWTTGNRLKFSCTVYFARQFDAMRRRCGVADGFNRSLAESANWLAEGGKSKANFFKTRDDRYIIKSLVNAWNVADLQILIEMAPSYFRYIDSTHSKASVLAKMLGFYTIEVKNLETGATPTRADVLVMENLMFGRNITQTFDLKGIKGRKVKPGGKSGATLFDGEWMEGASRALLLVRPHSKLILQEAVKYDAEFLAKANIMDYSLLLGVDEERSEIAWSYTFAKNLENKAKSNLQSGREVTVVPPAEYQDRFVKAMERYFLACPDKWSKPAPTIPDVYDPAQLPSVL
ncbi:1-phosphatidylinositol-3-phosphate 5-kinase [Rhizoctonia solani AG-1 IB]|uniref:1-phosphatidylinositol-3-phosphate 5-kinase n=1 Tax=Thanatephorus cucumeris (strain AG1-IB / isolate 7/3/14) TaxID=1108050 RepID=M5BZY2_THACB|nr:1-phosphatidylinositol-3-phosphate 5-kinase [Rhizoctonia solani AG-1 IB]